MIMIMMSERRVSSLDQNGDRMLWEDLSEYNTVEVLLASCLIHEQQGNLQTEKVGYDEEPDGDVP